MHILSIFADKSLLLCTIAWLLAMAAFSWLFSRSS